MAGRTASPGCAAGAAAASDKGPDAGVDSQKYMRFDEGRSIGKLARDHPATQSAERGAPPGIKPDGAAACYLTSTSS